MAERSWIFGCLLAVSVFSGCTEPGEDAVTYRVLDAKTAVSVGSYDTSEGVLRLTQQHDVARVVVVMESGAATEVVDGVALMPFDLEPGDSLLLTSGNGEARAAMVVGEGTEFRIEDPHVW